MRKAIAALAVLFFAAHVPFLPPTLEDLDSINFALGVQRFDVAKHQPHPPGYPVFIAMSKGSTAVLRSVGVASPAPRGLAIWSAMAGALLVFPLFTLFLALDASEARAWWATFVVAMSPLFWFTALRPLSDTSGLAAAVASQALALSVVAGRARPRALVWAALIAGLALGIRSQSLLLTFPALLLALLWRPSNLVLRDRVAALAAFSIGVAAWGVALVIASGGPSAYAAALGSQAGEDLSGVVMLWNQRHAGLSQIARVGADALAYSLVWPWAHKGVAAIVLVAAAAGCVRLGWRRPGALAVLAITFVPYAIFHLLFHEVVTTRYALPLLIPIAFCVVQAVSLAGPRALAVAACALAGWGLWISVPASVAYGTAGSPTFRAFGDVISSAGDDRSRQRIVAMHAVMRRAADWIDPGPAVQFVKAAHGHEWLALVNAWRADPAALVSYVADPRRTDLALIDPMSRRGPSRYVWPFSEPPFVGGARPGNADVYAMRPPGWMLDRGWALTAEVAGVTAKDGYGPHLKPSIAWIRARQEPATLMIGGRHLVDGAPPVRITLSLNGQRLQDFDAAPGYFFRRIELPAGALAKPLPFVPLSVTSAAVDGSARPLATALEQFDVQSESVPMVGAESGWYEPEYNPRTAQAWRWTSEQAVLWVRPVGRDVRLTLSGESPLRYFDGALTVVVRAGAREVGRFSPATDFTESMVLPADALAAADGRVTISSDKMFIPAERGGPPDRRHLALRIYSYWVR